MVYTPFLDSHGIRMPDGARETLARHVRAFEWSKLFIFATAAVDIIRLRALLPKAFVGRAYRIVSEVTS